MEQLQEMVERARQNGWPSADVRELYIAFFEHVKHKRYPSSPVVPHGDNTLLFINAGTIVVRLCIFWLLLVPQSHNHLQRLVV